MHDGTMHGLQNATVSFSKSCLPCCVRWLGVALNVEPLQHRLKLAFKFATTVVVQPHRCTSPTYPVALDLVSNNFAT